MLKDRGQYIMASRHLVSIKGVKDGLVFVMDDQCEFAELLNELQYKLEHTHQTILSGPVIHVHVRLGTREASEEQKEEIRGLIGKSGNLFIQSIQSDQEESAAKPRLKVIPGMVRSGQTLQYEGNLMLLGDVNPGGAILSTGDIYVMGSLRGMAHAGMDGDERAIIAAAHFQPTQLRIADIVSRPPDEWGISETYMEYAYLHQGQMQIDKLSHLRRMRPDWLEYKGV